MASYRIQDNLTLQRALKAFHDELLSEGLEENCFFGCKLVFSELASNALRHAGGGEITLLFLDEQVEITLVCSAPFTLPAVSERVSVFAESGRGLYLIDTVCQYREATESGGVRVIVKR